MVEDTYGPYRGHDARRTAPGGAPADADGRPTNAHPAAAWASGGQAALLDRTFGREDITVVRHEVTDRLIFAGLAGDRLHGFVLAVNEMITNVVLHAGGRGRIALRVGEGSVHCAVIDDGPGIPDRFRSTPVIPGPSEVGGRGIWLAYQLCDQVTVETHAGGSRIELRIRLPFGDGHPGLKRRATAAG